MVFRKELNKNSLEEQKSHMEFSNGCVIKELCKNFTWFTSARFQLYKCKLWNGTNGMALRKIQRDGKKVVHKINDDSDGDIAKKKTLLNLKSKWKEYNGD